MPVNNYVRAWAWKVAQSQKIKAKPYVYKIYSIILRRWERKHASI